MRTKLIRVVALIVVQSFIIGQIGFAAPAGVDNTNLRIMRDPEVQGSSAGSIGLAVKAGQKISELGFRKRQLLKRDLGVSQTFQAKVDKLKAAGLTIAEAEAHLTETLGIEKPRSVVGLTDTPAGFGIAASAGEVVEVDRTLEEVMAGILNPAIPQPLAEAEGDMRMSPAPGQVSIRTSDGQEVTLDEKYYLPDQRKNPEEYAAAEEEEAARLRARVEAKRQAYKEKTGKDDFQVIVIQGAGFVGIPMGEICATPERFFVIVQQRFSERSGWKIPLLNAAISPIESADPEIVARLKRVVGEDRLCATWTNKCMQLANVVISDIQLDFHKPELFKGIYEDYVTTRTPNDWCSDATIKETGRKYIREGGIKLGAFAAAIREIGENMDPEALVIDETTVPPGTTEYLILPILTEEFEKRLAAEQAKEETDQDKELIRKLQKALKKDRFGRNRIHVVHSYERVMPGPQYIWSIEEFPRQFAATNPVAAMKGRKFLQAALLLRPYSKELADLRIPTLRMEKSTRASESAKTKENTHRGTNIASNYALAKSDEIMGIDNWEQRTGIITRKGTHDNMTYPDLGVGGYCLTKDLLLKVYMTAMKAVGGEKALKDFFSTGELPDGMEQEMVDWIYDEDKDHQLFTIVNAVALNDLRPLQAAKDIVRYYKGEDALEETGEAIELNEDIKIRLVGTSYLEDVGDTRYSPVKTLAFALHILGADVTCHDPFVPEWNEAEDEEMFIQEEVDGEWQVVRNEDGRGTPLLPIEKVSVEDFVTGADTVVLIRRHEQYTEPTGGYPRLRPEVFAAVRDNMKKKNEATKFDGDIKQPYVFDAAHVLDAGQSGELTLSHKVVGTGRGEIEDQAEKARIIAINQPVLEAQFPAILGDDVYVPSDAVLALGSSASATGMLVTADALTDSSQLARALQRMKNAGLKFGAGEQFQIALYVPGMEITNRVGLEADDVELGEDVEIANVFEAIAQATEGAVDLVAADFALVFGDDRLRAAGDSALAYANQHLTANVRVVVGPEYMLAPITDSLTEGEILSVMYQDASESQLLSAGNAFLAGIEAVASDGALDDGLAARLQVNVLTEGSVFEVAPVDIQAEHEEDLETYRAVMDEV